MSKKQYPGQQPFHGPKRMNTKRFAWYRRGDDNNVTEDLQKKASMVRMRSTMYFIPLGQFMQAISSALKGSNKEAAKTLLEGFKRRAMS